MAQSKEKLNTVRNILMLLWSNMGMDTPENIEEIVQFVFNDVNECADPIKWHSGDVAIGFRRWIEAQAMYNKELKVLTGMSDSKGDKIRMGDMLSPSIGDQLNTVGELRKLRDDTTVNEVRFC